jgi:hypothetical protein
VKPQLALALDCTGCKVSLFATTGRGLQLLMEDKISVPKGEVALADPDDNPEYAISKYIPPG